MPKTDLPKPNKRVVRKKTAKKEDDGDTVKRKIIEIPKPRIQRAYFNIQGLSPLIQNGFPEQTLEQIAKERESGGTQKSKKKVIEPLDPRKEMLSKIHFIDAVKKPNGEPDLKRSQYGHPVAAFKKSMAEVGYGVFGIFKKQTYAALALIPDAGHLISFKTPRAPTMRRGWGKLHGKSLIVYYQPVFDEWALTIDIAYDMDLTDLDTIAALLMHAGVKVGVGNNRPQVGGENGTFEVTKFGTIA